MSITFESANQSKTLLESYDRYSGKWEFPKEDDFWEAVKLAHTFNIQGENKTIAIVDGGFDLSIPKLKRSSKLFFSENSNTNILSHGTIVALLILEVAPKANLNLYDISVKNKPRLKLLHKCSNIIKTSAADIVNLSLGGITGNFSLNLRKFLNLKGHCKVCNAVEPIAKNKVVVAAAGNAKGKQFCPGRRSDVISIGFHGVLRGLENSETGGLMERAFAKVPSFSQSETLDFALLQPEGVLGSSFATPLISGAISLLNNQKDIYAYLKAAYFSSIAEAIHPTLNKNSPNEIVKKVESYYLQAFKELPHFHTFTQAENFCFGCAFFAQKLFTNGGLFIGELGKLNESERILSIATKLAPWSPHAAANRAAIQREITRQDMTKNVITKNTYMNIEKSIRGFETALTLRPGFEAYKTGLRESIEVKNLLHLRL